MEPQQACRFLWTKPRKPAATPILGEARSPYLDAWTGRELRKTVSAGDGKGPRNSARTGAPPPPPFRRRSVGENSEAAKDGLKIALRERMATGESCLLLTDGRAISYDRPSLMEVGAR